MRDLLGDEKTDELLNPPTDAERNELEIAKQRTAMSILDQMFVMEQ